jgi:hypothetical protein
MDSRRRILATVLFTAFGVAILWQVLSPNELRYHGKKESAWLRDLNSGPLIGGDYTGKSHDDAAEAFRQMGTNALPYLLIELNARNPTTKISFLDQYRNKTILRDYFDSGDERRGNAAQAFRALGPIGKAAIPALIPLTKDTNTCLEAMFCLDFIGAEGVPALIEGLTNRQKWVRHYALFALSYRPEIAKPAAAALLNTLNDSDMDVRVLATNALLIIDPVTAAKAGIK